jgi:hypothetical protein
MVERFASTHIGDVCAAANVENPSVHWPTWASLIFGLLSERIRVLAHRWTPDSSIRSQYSGKPSGARETVKRTAFRSQKLFELPIAWREVECTLLRANSADAYDGRVSDNSFDNEDERAEVEIVVQMMNRGFN